MEDGLGIGSLPLLTYDEEEALVQRVRAGDEQARHALVLAVLRRVLPSTKTWICGGSHGMWRIELADVMQHAYAALWGYLPQVIGLENVPSCLVVRARWTISEYLQQQRSLILVSTKVRLPVPIVESLDEPFEGKRVRKRKRGLIGWSPLAWESCRERPSMWRPCMRRRVGCRCRIDRR